jgi:type II secretory pathway pseudopilin PulG
MIRRTRRSGFTIVELLVAVALAIAILGLAVAVLQSSAFESYKAVGAADRLSQWMIVAKNKALRDKAPRGIRLIPDATNPEFIREIAYIEQPDPIPSNGPMLLGSRLTFYYPCRVTQTTMPQSTSYDFDVLAPVPMGATPAPAGRGVYLTLSTAQLATFSSTVQANDLVSIPELRSVLRLGNPTHFLAPLAPPGPNNATTATILLNITGQQLPDLGRNVYSYHNSSTLDGAAHPLVPPSPTNGTLTIGNFSIVRAARPILGEPAQQLPSGMAVDVRAAVATSLNPPPADVNGNRDILFAPTGEVIGTTEALSLFLVRDVNLPNVVNPLTTDFERAGQMILICLYNKTGAIATQPVNPPPAIDPYRFARDGINTGL